MKFDHFHNCEHPLLIRNKYTKEFVEVPCGTCSACRLRKNSHYVPLILREASCHKYQIFFTLTYANWSLPKCDLHKLKVPDKFKIKYFDLYEKSKEYIEFCNYMLPFCPSRDAQRFVKRLRENIYRQLGLRGQIRYFISPDYGSNGFRPHWHGLLFFSNEQIADCIEKLIADSWSVENCGTKYPIGRIDVQHAYSAAKYVSVYVRADSDRPVILFFRAFTPRPLFSSSPSFGSMASVIETNREIVEHGLTSVHLYDSEQYAFREQPLTSFLVRQLFPAVPLFDALSRDERCRLYSVFTDYLPQLLLRDGQLYNTENRRIALRWRMLHDSFFRDYVLLNDCSLNDEQINRKLDTLFYVVKRLHRASSSLGVDIMTYDSYIEKYRHNLKQSSLRKQFEFEDRFMLKYRDCKRLASFIDLSKPLPYGTTPVRYDNEYFLQMRELYNKSLKRKVSNAYLELHPEFKQFH